MKCKNLQNNLKRKIRILCYYFSPKNIYFRKFLLLIFITHGIIFAQTEMRFEHITVREGLPENSVSQILQDQQGFLWFATQYGPVKYDGYKFTVYGLNSSDSLNTRFSVYSLYEDNSRNLWIGTEFGICRYDREKDVLESFFLNSEEFYSYSICEDYEGNLYFGSQLNDAGLYKFNKHNKSYTKFVFDSSDSNSISSNYVREVYKEDSTIMWIGTIGGGLNRFDTKTGIFIKYKHNPLADNSISSNDVFSIYKDKVGNLWVGTNHGLNKFNYSNETFTSFIITQEDTVRSKPYAINKIYEDKPGNLWLSVLNYGIVKFEPESGRTVRYKHEPDNHYSLSTDFIQTIFEDKSGILWIGTSWGGLDKFDRQKSQFVHYNNIFDKNFSVDVYSIQEDSSGAIWLGTSNGLSRFNSNTNTFTDFNKINKSANPLSSKDVLCLCFDSYKNLWIGTGNGLNKYDIKKGELKNYFHKKEDTNSISNNRVLYIHQDKYNDLWIGTSIGLNMYDRKNERFNVYNHNDNDSSSISDNNIMYISDDSKYDLWIGTNYGGLNKFDRSVQIFKHYFYPLLGFSSISSICEDKKGRFWIGTYMSGLNLFDRNTGKIKSFSENEGLVNNGIYSVIEDNNGYLWIGTQNGLSRFNPYTYEIKNFDKNDLPLTYFRRGKTKDKNGYLYFGCTGGFIKFHPDSIKDNQNIPEIVLTEFRLSNIPVKPSQNSPLKKNINIADEITLSYKQNIFSFEFAALDYHNPMKNKYAYMLEGFNKDWVYTDASNRIAAYTNIDPGEYIFRVKGSNNDGIWNEKGTSVKVVITPPFWITWWFKACGAVIILGGIGFIFKKRIKKIKKEKIFQEEFTRQLISAHEDERKRIARELHDSLSQNLLVIKNKAEQNIKQKEFNPEIINEISDLSSSTLQEVREISYNLHPYQLERLGLTKAIQSIIKKASESSKIKFRSDINIIDKLFTPETEINLFRIVQECINNIIKHSGATETQITVDRTADKVTIEIKDNGIGFDSSSVKSKPGLGLKSLYERANLCNANVEIDSQPGKGTIIYILIPFRI